MNGARPAPITVSALVERAAEAGGAELVGDGEVEVRGCAHDSRAVPVGALFCCVPGALADGHDHAAAAVAEGASALLCERRLDLAVPQIVVPSVRAAMGPVAAQIHGDPAQRLTVLGVTGTNGKTTVVSLLGAIGEAAGQKVAVIGTLTGARTTPEAPELQSALAAAVADGGDIVAMEVSSHALDQRRVDGTRFAVAGFTNLSPDHLDHHVTMERYFAAKARLLTPELAERAVVCVEDQHGRLLRDSAVIPTVGVGWDDADEVRLTATGSELTWRGQPIRLPMVGRFNVLNALVAAEMAVAAGLAPEQVARGLAQAPTVPGRLEPIDEGQPFGVVVDYAHTPDGIASVIAALREVRSGRIAIVFGCGGDRDRTKRPLMGEAAAAADRVILTTDNPRSEDPGAIMADVLPGLPPSADLLIEPDRRAAIATALAEAGPDDVVLIAGKGHETVQIFADRTEPFDDRAVARQLLRGGESR